MAKKPQFDSITGMLVNKEELIAEEANTLRKTLFPIIPDVQKQAAAASLIEDAAFLRVSMIELRHLISVNGGYVESYQNGENQTGMKESTYSKTYIQYSKQHLACRKQLSAMVLKEQKEQAKTSTTVSDGFDDFVFSRAD